MSVPLPDTVHVEPSNEALPAAATLPMSACDQPIGRAWPDSSRTVNGALSASPLRPAVSVTITLIRLVSLGGAGCCHTHWRAAGATLVHSVIAVKCAPSSDEEKTSKRASGVSPSVWVQRMV